MLMNAICQYYGKTLLNFVKVGRIKTQTLHKTKLRIYGIVNFNRGMYIHGNRFVEDLKFNVQYRLLTANKNCEWPCFERFSSARLVTDKKELARVNGNLPQTPRRRPINRNVSRLSGNRNCHSASSGPTAL